VALARLAALLPVDVIPGDGDPTTSALPQQPVHPLLLPTAHRYAPKTFVSATNPHECLVGGVKMLGHAGQPVLDLLKHADYTTASSAEQKTTAVGLERRSCVEGDAECVCVDRVGDARDDAFLAALEDTLYWGHLAPTAPDSLAVYPFQEADPFVLDAPDDDDPPARLVFAGGARDFATSVAKRTSLGPDDPGCRIVALPSFAQTGVAALVDLDTLEVERLCFKTASATVPAAAAPPKTTTAGAATKQTARADDVAATDEKAGGPDEATDKGSAAAAPSAAEEP